MEKVVSYTEWFSQEYDEVVLEDQLTNRLIQILQYVLKTSDAHDRAVRAQLAPTNYVISENQTWVITQNCLLINQFPSASSFTIKTKVVAANRFFTTRQFIIEEASKLMMTIYIQFTAIDLSTRKMARLNLTALEAITTESLPFVKLLIPQNIEPLNERTIEITDKEIDLNNHVNNLHYLKWSLQSLVETFTTESLARIDIKYGNELLKEHQAHITSYQVEDSVIMQRIMNDTLQKESSLVQLKFNTN